MEDNKTADKEAPALDLKQIRQIVALMADNNLTHFNFERDGSKIELRRGSDLDAARQLLASLPVQQPMVTMAAPAAAPVAAAPAPAAAPSASADPVGPTVNSPMVGTFYRSAAPGEKSFINIGDPVDENTTVCIIEAMKVMNEIKAEMRGILREVLVENALAVQFGQPLFRIQPL